MAGSVWIEYPSCHYLIKLLKDICQQTKRSMPKQCKNLKSGMMTFSKEKCKMNIKSEEIKNKYGK